MNQSGSLKNVQIVYAHAQALAQCHQWLTNHLPENIQRIAVSSNAEAAHLAQQQPHAAAIASQAAAEIYGLTKLANNIEDEPNNTTRFLVLGHQATLASGSDKTSLIISVPNKVGTLHHIIETFSRDNISMTKFESRPSRTGLWEYLFFVDIEGHASEAHVQAALAELQARTAFVKIVGAYPQAVL